ncbi:hypothetical protein ASD81_13040 [Nocardioides sp. Root614]|nr:hypothetical protein ASD81_13040 [Nocardioides sp. Root614]KRA89136.1 hypothetical protein ASD84_13305 [Nocardioides sp. Root682]
MGVTSVDLDVYGAQGSNNGWYNSSYGGKGGRTAATLAVTPGDHVDLLVGQSGSPGTGATYGGGGASGGGQSYLGSGGGGSFVFDADGDLLVAAGGGGGGGSNIQGGDGAGAAQSGGNGGVESVWTEYGDSGAQGASPTAGGAGGRNEAHFAFGTAGGGPADAGAPGQGGGGGYSPYNPYFSGAGGGGGYYGGGGGGAFHGGAGGSGFADPASTDVVAETGVRNGDGVVTVTYDRPAPETALTAAPDGGSVDGDSVTFTAEVTSTVATATGTVAFTDGETTIPDCEAVALVAGEAVCETSALAPGSHDVVATYSGDVLLAPAEFGTTYAVAHKPVHVTTTSLPGGQTGSPYSAQLTAEDGLGPYTWHVTAGSLPPGMTLSPDGALSGTPTAVSSGGAVTFEVSDAQDVPFTDSLELTLSVLLTDVVRPTATITVPRGLAAYRVASWRTLTGTARDSGDGVKNVSVRVIEKRGTGWYGYQASTGRWVRTSSTTAAWNVATPRTVAVTNGVWKSPVVGLTQGRIAVRVRATDNAGNRSETARTAHVLDRR